MNSSSQNTQSPLKTDTISSKWYRNISELPLSRFIDCLVDENIYSLVISGKPEHRELLEAWQAIRIQYADVIKDNDYIAYARLNRQVAQLEMLYKQILIAINELKERYTVQFHEALNSIMGHKFKLDVTKPEEYDNELKRAANRSKGTMLELSIKKMALDSMVEKMATKGSVATREYFNEMLITLSDHAEYRLKSEDMTVFEYCVRVRRLHSYYETLNKKKK